MELFSRNSAVLLGLFTSLSILHIPSVAAFDLTGCSTQNTGTDHQVLNTIYLSLGKCHDTCQASDYAFGIVQGQYCWCSNYAPASTVDTSECDTNCPGWPYEFCASSSAGVFGYIALSNKPSGTASSDDEASSSSSSSSTPSSSSSTVDEPATSAAPTTVIVLSTISAPAAISTVWPSFSGETITSLSQHITLFGANTDQLQSPPTTAFETVTNVASSSITIFATPYVSVKTVLGSAQTITVSPTDIQIPAETQPPLPSSQPSNDDSFWSNTGKVAGTFTVVGLLIAGLIGAGLFFLWRRYRRNEDAMTVASNDEQPTSSNGAPYMVDRRRSNLTLATGGLAGLTRGSSHEKSPVDNSNNNNNNNRTPASMSRRGSIPMSHDQRLNPAALYNTIHPNGSRASVNTFQDERDYSRPVLHIRNPDSQ